MFKTIISNLKKMIKQQKFLNMFNFQLWQINLDSFEQLENLLSKTRQIYAEANFNKMFLLFDLPHKPDAAFEKHWTSKVPIPLKDKVTRLLGTVE